MPKGEIVTATTEIIPPIVYVAGKQYPHDVIEKMRAQGLKVLAIDAASVAKRLGNIRAMNVVLLGAVSPKLGFSAETWERALKSRIPTKYIELNLRAFDEGRALATRD